MGEREFQAVHRAEQFSEQRLVAIAHEFIAFFLKSAPGIFELGQVAQMLFLGCLFRCLQFVLKGGEFEPNFIQRVFQVGILSRRRFGNGRTLFWDLALKHLLQVIDFLVGKAAALHSGF